MNAPIRCVLFLVAPVVSPAPHARPWRGGCGAITCLVHDAAFHSRVLLLGKALKAFRQLDAGELLASFLLVSATA